MESEPLALYFTPEAIRQHFEGDEGPLADAVRDATDEALRLVGIECVTADSLYREFHRLLVEVGTETLLGEPEDTHAAVARGLHWRMTYAERRLGDTGRYVVYTGGSERLQFATKSDAIAQAQRLNGYEPVDGSEQTYGEQLKTHVKTRGWR